MSTGSINFDNSITGGASFCSYWGSFAFDDSKGADTTPVSIAKLPEEQRLLWPETDKSLCFTVGVSLECDAFDVERADGISTSLEVETLSQLSWRMPRRRQAQSRRW
jgi:hypothetical protein